MTTPSIFLIHRIKKVEKLTVENFDFPQLIFFGFTFKEPALENSYYLKKEVGRRFVLTLTTIRYIRGIRGKKIGKKSQKVHKTMANLALQKFRPGSSILPSSSFRPEHGKQAAELQIDTQKRLPTLALSPNRSPSGYLCPTGDLFLYVGPLFCPMSPFSPID